MVNIKDICIVTAVHNKKYINHFKNYPQVKLYDTNLLRNYDTKNFKYEQFIFAAK